jgi:hypothetical protein
VRIKKLTLHVRCGEDIAESRHIAAAAGIVGAVVLEAIPKAVVECARRLGRQERRTGHHQERYRIESPSPALMS